MIETKNLEKVFTTEEVETTALNKVNLKIKEGEFISVMGPSGCGKSTLLNILGLLDNPTTGEYRFLGEDVTRHSERQRAHRYADLEDANEHDGFRNDSLFEAAGVHHPAIRVGVQNHGSHWFAQPMCPLQPLTLPLFGFDHVRFGTAGQRNKAGNQYEH